MPCPECGSENVERTKKAERGRSSSAGLSPGKGEVKVGKDINRKIAVWLGWKWNVPPKRQTWDPYWSDETGMSVHPSRTFFTENDGAAVTLLPVLVKRGYFPELYYSTDSEGFSAWYFTETPGQPYFLGQTIAAAITASVSVLAEAVRL